MKTNNLPIVICRERHPIIVDALIENTSIFENMFSQAAEKVLKVMTSDELLCFPERDAIILKCQKNLPAVTHFLKKIGGRFKNAEIETRCRQSCQEQCDRTSNNDREITSYQSRNPNDNRLGGAIKVSFLLMHNNNESIIITYCSSCAGLTEWENTTLCLGILYSIGIIKFNDPQIQTILHEAGLAVKNDLSSQPKGGISKYVRKVFGAIENEKDNS